MDFRGNRWYKCDLHLHTPESKCFPNKSVTAEEWVQACLATELEVVAVTDHNSGNHIDQIIDAAKETRLTVFPGVEITCDTSKIHLLILFDTDKRSSDINAFLHFCGIEDHKFAQQDATTGVGETIFTIAEKATSRGALVIPAHIDEYSGISEASFQTIQTFLNRTNITGVQVVNKELYYHNKYSARERLEALAERYPDINGAYVKKWSNSVKLSQDKNKAILTFSDNPSGPNQTSHGLYGIGSRFTWIKMEEKVSLESLRHALLMPHQKIRNDFDYQTNPYNKPDLLIKGLIIKGTILNKKKPIHIHFNPQLNTIIGGRGTGKSAINRIIRGLLDNNSDLIDLSELFNEQTDFFKQNEISRGEEEKKGILTSDTIIELYLERLGRTHKIIYSNYQDGQFTKSFYTSDSEGVFEESAPSILEFFRAEIYSQKQIYHIATRPNALREKIDQSIALLEEHLSTIENHKNNYFVTTAKIRATQNRIDKKGKLEIEKTDIEERLRQFEEAGYQSTLKEQKKSEADYTLLHNVINDLEQKEIRLRDFVNEFTYPDVDAFEFSSDAQEELKIILARNSTEFQEIISKLLEGSTALSSVKQSLNQAVESSAWNKNFDKVKKEYQSLQEELTSEELTDLENIETLSTQLANKQKELEDIALDEKELVTQTDELNGISEYYLELRKQVTSFRKTFLQTVLADTPNIKIEVKPFRDSENFENELRKIFQKPDTFVEDFSEINNFIFNGLVEQKIQDFRNLIASIRGTKEDCDIFSRRFNGLIQSLNEDQMDKIRLLYPEDRIEVQYKANEASGFKSISNASAGQKTSAILTFLLSYGSSPLLLDQPEDDLDNQLIYDLIVNRVTHSKNNRQIIAVTHNANIPVNGDSEWVTAMNSESKDIEVLCEGSIENQKIKDAICNIMEGGRIAFELRAKRYQIEI